MTEKEVIDSIRKARVRVVELRRRGFPELARLVYKQELRASLPHRSHDVNAALCSLELAYSVSDDVIRRLRP